MAAGPMRAGAILCLCERLNRWQRPVRVWAYELHWKAQLRAAPQGYVKPRGRSWLPALQLHHTHARNVLASRLRRIVAALQEPTGALAKPQAHPKENVPSPAF